MLEKVTLDCITKGETAVIAGHYIIRGADKEVPELIVGSDADWATYTHIVYLNTEPTLAV